MTKYEDGFVLQAIRDYMGMAGRPPTVRTLAALCGMPSSDTAARHLRRLERAGLIVREAGASNAIRLVQEVCPYCQGTGRCAS